MKWICIVALVINLLLFAFAGYAFITVPNSEVQRVKAALHEKIERAESGEGFIRTFEGMIDPADLGIELEELDLETLLQMQEATPTEEEPQAAGERPKIRTYDIDYMEEPYARGDAQAQGVEDAKEKIRTRPFQ